MKKYLLLLITFLTSFIFYTNVKAYTLIDNIEIPNQSLKFINLRYYTDDEINNNFTNGSDNLFKTYIEVRKWAINKLSTNGYSNYIIIRGNSISTISGFNSRNFNVIFYNDNGLTYSNLEFSIGKRNTYGYYYILSAFFKSNNYYQDVHIDSSNNISYGSNSSNYSNVRTYESLGTSLPTSYNMYYDSSLSINYGTNIIKKWTFWDYGYNSFTFSDDEQCYQTYYEGDLMVDNEGNNDWSIKSYEYEGLIKTYDKSKIEIDFDIPENETFSFDIDLLTQFSDIYLSKPYLEYTDIYDNITISQIDDFLGERTEVGATDTEGNELYQYEGNFGIDFNELKQLKIIFDVSNYTYDLYLKFTSSLNYNINYIYSIDDNNYYKTIFMNDKYGIYLIPKTKNSDNFSTINLSGKYNIEIRNNYIDSENYDLLEKYTDYIEPNFQYKYTFNNLNYLIYFENVNYNTEEDDSYYLTFDTRQFNYVIKELQFDTPTINNPNTGEDLILPPIDNINKEQDISGFMDYMINNKNIEIFFENFSNIYKKFKSSKQIGQYLFLIIGTSIIILYIKVFKK